MTEAGNAFTTFITTQWKAIAVSLLIIASTYVTLGLHLDYEKCEDRDNCLVIAYEVKDTYLIWDKNPQDLADRMSEATGMDVEIYSVGNEAATIEAIDKGTADIGFVDGAAAWLAWEVYGLDLLAAETKSDGRTYYNAAAWVRADSDMAAAYLDDDPDTDPFALMEGKTSCHTGWLKSAGMLIPMGYLIANGYAEVQGNESEIDSLRATVHHFFSEDSSIPEGGTPYSSYKGALRCMMDGTGDVALVKDTVYESYCVKQSNSWCLENNTEVVMLSPWGQAPSHPVLYNPDTMDIETRAIVREALDALDDDAEGVEILEDLLNTEGMVITNASAHLGTYGAAVADVPGIQAFIESR
tara:strand:- start:4518 stop:5582 length:1065 start_codon:yes stop_codon:yes gene_type:complete